MLEVTNLHCERDERVLFRDLSFSVDAGQVLQVQGANGSGKTTLLRTLCGLNQDFTGSMRWRGEEIRRNRAAFHEELFYLGHAPAINKTLTPVENLRWFCASRGIDAGGITEALHAFNLHGYDDMPSYLMSAGQQRRVSLSRMYLCRAALWILDEPFTALDRRGVADLEHFLAGRVKNGGAVILTTHHTLRMEHPVDIVDLDELAASGRVVDDY